ncbi:conserved hypothetical protein [Staphylococcus aureus]|uniref:Uncharacterized protein n=1 Tax=Staphylococcus aureus TaxID=1280 RepID=A0A0U1MSN9_STAAU|nr:conserved hypothetical protein [Staphylococcus aureus]
MGPRQLALSVETVDPISLCWVPEYSLVESSTLICIPMSL